MAINLRQRLPLQQARAHRVQLPRYLRLDGGRSLIAAAVLLALMGLLSLGQTGRLATKGYELGRLQSQKTELLRQQSALQLRVSEAQSLTKIERRAAELQLRPMTPDQARYITIEAGEQVTEDTGQGIEDERQETAEGQETVVNGTVSEDSSSSEAVYP